jgi:hypothetical protein
MNEKGEKAEIWKKNEYMTEEWWRYVHGTRGLKFKKGTQNDSK